jgi:hypothetical protein
MTAETKRIADAIKAMQGKPCILCGSASAVAGLFAANDQAAVGAPIGKTRLVAYALCDDCFGSDHQERVEAVIFRDVGRAMAAPNN